MKNYLINNIAILSHLLNTLTGGKHYHTFSARVGYASKELNKRWAVIAEKIINKIFFQQEHCLNEYLTQKKNTF